MSTIRVNNLQNTSTTDGGISINNSGHVTVDGVAMPSAGPLSNRNLVINGAMQVAQRGTSSTSSDRQTVDGFFFNFGGGLAGTQSQQTLSSGDPYDEGFRKFYRMAISTPSTAAGTYCQMIQKMEGQNIATSGWQYASSNSDITISFWVRSSVAQTFYGQLISVDGTLQNYVYSFALSANTWTKITKTIPGNSNITIDNDNGEGLQMVIVPFFGTDLSDSGVTVDAWQAYSGSSRVPDMTSTWANTNGATFDVTGVQLEVGSVATPFEHRSFGDELARCQRYFEKSVNYGTAATGTTNPAPTLVGSAYTTALIRTQIFYKVSKRATPTITPVPATTGSGTGTQWARYNGSWAVASTSVAQSNENAFSVDLTTSGISAFSTYLVDGNWYVSSEL